MNQLVIQQSCGWALCMEYKGKDFPFTVALSVLYFISADGLERSMVWNTLGSPALKDV